ncbi:MAG: TolC family protein [Bryobacterales bacterium]
MLRTFLAAALLAAPALAQEPLALEEAARIALESHPALEAASAGVDEASARVRAAQSGYLPKLSWQESYTRSNNPVFAFGSLLNQRRFTESNFAIQSLNNPSSIQNFQSLLRVEQTVWDANRTKNAIRAARLQEELSREQRRGGEADVLLGVVRTYFGAVVAAEGLKVAETSVESARADRERAQSMFDSGMTTQAGVLAVQAHLAELEQNRIQAAGDAEIAQSALADALGLDLDVRRTLATPLSAAPRPAGTLEEFLARARENRADLKLAALGVDLAEAGIDQAKSNRLPMVIAQGALEADRARFVDQGGGNWLAGAALRWDLWRGGETRAKLDAARAAEHRAAALRRRAVSGVELEVRKAWTDFDSATERLKVADAAVSQAQESLRIVRDRHEAGLETVTELLRSQTALIGAQFRRLGALYDQRIARAALDHAAGVLSLTSEALQ